MSLTSGTSLRVNDLRRSASLAIDNSELWTHPSAQLGAVITAYSVGWMMWKKR